MEQGAVHDGAETAVVAGERGDVGDLEGHVQAPPGRFGASQLDGGRRGVHAYDGVAAFGEAERDGRPSASRVQDVAVESARVDECGEFRLRRADAPGRFATGGERAGAAIEIVEVEFTRCGHRS